MGLIRIAASTPDKKLVQYPPSGAKADTLYVLTFRGGKQGPFAITRKEGNEVAFLLEPSLSANDIEMLTEVPPVKRIESTDGAYIDNPTPRQVLAFYHDRHQTMDIALVV